MFFKKKDVYYFGESKKKKKGKAVTATEADQQAEESPIEETLSPDVTPPVPGDKTISSPTDKESEWIAPPITIELADTEIKEKNKKKKERVKFDLKKFIRNKRKMGLLLIGTSLFVLVVVSPTLNVVTSQEMTTAVVLTDDIPKGTLIDSQMITTIDVPKAALLPIQVGQRDKVVGKYACSDMVKGEIISYPKVSEAIPFDDSYLYDLPDGKKAISITMPYLSSSLSSKVMAGDIVSVYARVKDEKTTKAVLVSELTYVKVLAITNQDAYDLTTTPEKEEYENQVAFTVVLLVDDRQAEKLVALEGENAIHLALVHRGDPEKANNFLKIQEVVNSREG